MLKEHQYVVARSKLHNRNWTGVGEWPALAANICCHVNRHSATTAHSVFKNIESKWRRTRIWTLINGSLFMHLEWGQLSENIKDACTYRLDALWKSLRKKNRVKLKVLKQYITRLIKLHWDSTRRPTVLKRRDSIIQTMCVIAWFWKL